MSKEAMKLALEALNDIIPANANIEEVRHKQSKAAAALREELAEQLAQQQQDDAWKAEQKTLADEAVKCATEALANPNHPATMAAREYYGAAQPQEPVARIEITRCKFTGELESWTFAERPRNAPAGAYYVYTSPQPAQRKPLTDGIPSPDELEALSDGNSGMIFNEGFPTKLDRLACWLREYAAIEAAHGIKKNT